MSRLIFSVILAILATSLTSAQAIFTDFSSTIRLKLLGNASIVESNLQLTPLLNSQVGGAWLKTPQHVANGFDTRWDFQIFPASGYNRADGLAFVIQNCRLDTLGSAGGYMGYDIRNSVAFEFDIYKNVYQEIPDGAVPHVTVQSRGSGINSASHKYSLANTATINFADGAVHTVRILYQSDTCQVYLDNLSTPVLRFHLALDSLLSLNKGQAWVGFTAATGRQKALHQILNWSFAPATIKPQAVILIHGVLASSLYNSVDNHLDSYLEHMWFNVEQLILPFDLWLNPLELKEDGQNPADPDFVIRVAPQPDDDHTLRDELAAGPLHFYQPLAESLEAQGLILDNLNLNHAEGENLFLFTYDWRLGMATASSKLAMFMDSVRSWTGSDKVDVVAHSFGGLVTKHYAKVNGPAKLGKVIFLGVPQLGSPQMTYTLLTGQLDGLLGFTVNAAEWKKLERNFPTAYELLPSARYFDLELNNGYSDGTVVYQNYLRRGSNQLNFEQASTHLNSAGVNIQLLNQAQTAQQSLNEVSLGDSFCNIASWGLATSAAIVVNEISGKVVVSNERLLTGDQTVPLRSAEITNSNQRQADFYVYRVKHSDLPSNPVVIGVVLQKLGLAAAIPRNPILTTTPPQSYEADPSWVVRVGCPVRLDVYDSLGNHVGPTSDSTWNEDIPGSSYLGGSLFDPEATKIINVPKGGVYNLTVTPLDTVTNFDMEITSQHVGRATSSWQFNNVALLSSSTALAQLTDSLSNVSLGLDENGDGQPDTKVEPSNILVTSDVTAGWNLLSLPVKRATALRELFPTAQSSAYQYKDGYHRVDSLEPGIGYWIKFSATDVAQFSGGPYYHDTLALVEGWNMVGSLSVPLAVDRIETNPLDLLGSKFYKFHDGYLPADTLTPGQGYWVKARQNGKIILK